MSAVMIAIVVFCILAGAALLGHELLQLLGINFGAFGGLRDFYAG